MKKRITAIILSVVIMFSMIPFSIVKAETLATSHWEWSEGSYTYQILLAGSSETLELSTYGITSNVYKSANIIEVQFNDFYTGSIKIRFQTSVNLADWNYKSVRGLGASYNSIGSLTVGTTSYPYVMVDLVNCQNFTLIMASGTANLANGAPYGDPYTNFTDSGWTFEIGDINMPGYQFDIYQLPAVLIATNNFNCVTYEDGYMYPVLNLPSGSRGTLLRMNSISESVFIFISKNTIDMSSTNGRTPDITTNYGRHTLTLTSGAYAQFQNYRIYILKLNNSSGSSQTDYLKWNVDSQIIPLYFGHANGLPDDLIGLVYGVTPSYQTVAYLRSILSALTNSGDSGQTSQDIGNIADQVDDITDQEHDITDGFISDLDDFNTDVDLDNYDFISGIVGISSYFKIQLENVFNESSYIRAFWIIPVICVVFIRLLGS